MSFPEHLDELRRRLIRVLLVVAVGTACAFAFAPRLFDVLLLPYGSRLKVIGPTEGIASYLRVAAIAGLLASMPYILLELWGFVSPALRPRERRLAIVFVPSASMLFFAGVAFAWFVVIPPAVGFLSGLGLDYFSTEWTARNYLSFLTTLLVWIGLCAELPLVVFFLASLGVVSARSLWRGWRYAIVLIAVVSALITPTVDPVTMTLVALPMVALYFLGISLAVLAGRGKPTDAGEAAGR